MMKNPACLNIAGLFSFRYQEIGGYTRRVSVPPTRRAVPTTPVKAREACLPLLTSPFLTRKDPLSGHPLSCDGLEFSFNQSL